MTMALRRVLEPEVMDTEQDAVEYDSMDFAEVNLAFGQRALELAPASENVLDIGTGTARIPIVIIQSSPAGLHIHAIDLSQEMLKLAHKNIEAAHLTDRITIQLVDAKRLPFADSTYDMVISNSLVHHIPDPSHFFTEAGRVVKPGGAIFMRDLMRPQSMNDVDALVHQYVGDADPYQQKLFRDSLCASLTVVEVEEFISKAGIAGAHVVQSSDRHWSVERPHRKQ